MGHIETMEDELDRLIGRTRDRSSVYEVRQMDGAGRKGGIFGNASSGAEMLRREQIRAKNKTAEFRTKAHGVMAEQQAASVRNRQGRTAKKKASKTALLLYLIILLVAFLLQRSERLLYSLWRYPRLRYFLWRYPMLPYAAIVIIVFVVLIVVLPSIRRNRR